ncbi:MAG: low temperature requirement protein A [Acidimicrobiia bacterium]|nr:low temperature requirement protein A [Acidimicrobiia bacterium]NNF68530.1 low temperature requirement protein A [Acidimicrobiia bacterium]
MTSRQESRERVRSGMRTWFLTPPRRHGEVVYTREVSFLELFYDLVYVVLIAQVSHHLATHVGWRGVWEFVVVFGLIWLAWFNGTGWHELHGREDGRARNYIFTQMMLLAVLAVFAEGATGEDGPAFAITYAILFTLYTWQWHLIHRIDDPEYRPVTTSYLAGMVTTVLVVLGSAFVSDEARLWIWTILLVVWIGGSLVQMFRSGVIGLEEGVTGSFVERFGLFTIIVLGEVVVGVVGGISDADELTALTLATGIIALTIGYGLWWNYFDSLGRRIPRAGSRSFATWLFAHFPLTMAIAGGGAAMVSLVEHASDARTPAPTAWLLVGSVVVALAGIAMAARSLPDGEFPPGVVRAQLPTFAVAAVAILAVGAARPSPIILVSAVSVLLALTWLRLFTLFLAQGGRLRVLEHTAIEVK